MKQLENKRLLLRKFDINDASMMFDNWTSDQQVTNYLSWEAHLDIEETYTLLNEWIMSYNDGDYIWAIVNKDNNEVIGSIGIIIKDENNSTYEVGYCLSRKYWNKHITSDALRLVIDYLFNEININKIRSRYDVRNINSGKVLKTVGMFYIKTINEYEYIGDELIDVNIHEITRKDYLK